MQYASYEQQEETEQENYMEEIEWNGNSQAFPFIHWF